MADAGGSWGGFPTAVEALVTAAVAVAGFFSGIWTRGTAAGKTEGGFDARMIAIADRVAHVERRLESGDDRLSKLGERIAETPTRAEMATHFGRIEQRLDGLMRRQDEK